MVEGSRSAGPRYQVRLGDLAVIVVGAAFVFDVARRSRGAWGGAWPDLEHTPGLVMLTMATGLGLALALRGFRRLRAGEVGIWGATWRVAVLGWLSSSLLGLSAALPVRPADIDEAIPRDLAHARLWLCPLMISLGLVGVILGLSPIRPRRRAARAGPRLGSWPSVLLAGGAGLMMLVASGWVIVYLVTIAVDAVSNATRMAPPIARPPLFARLTRAGLETIPGLLGCLATASWVDDDLRNAARDPASARAPRSSMGVVARLAAVGLAVGGSAYTCLASVPRLDASIADMGRWLIFESSLMPAVVLGFAALAAGFASRSAAHLAATGPVGSTEEPAGPFGPWPRRIALGLACLVVADLVAAAVHALRGGLDDPWYVPVPLDLWARLILAPAGWFGDPTRVAWGQILERIGEILFVAATLWIAIRMVLLLAREDDGRPSPLDAIAGDRLALGRFLGWWLALTAAILASLPLLALAALTLTHHLIRWLAR